ncbi:MAG: hypothetical protein JXA54_10270 [Candidatus Heimdallarchaeota archaeon]|nr:hypothetical protein [Candidatus Heimdallarchaeota archaeon]
MRQLKFITPIFMFVILASSFVNFNYTTAGYENDPTGDAGGFNACDITRIDVDVTYHHPEDDEVILKITLLEAPLMDENHTIRYDYNFFIDTSLSLNTNTSTLTDDIYEYRAHLDCRWVSDAWLNTSWIMATRFYLTGDGSSPVMGTFWWNANTYSWQGSLPDVECGQVVGNTIVWDVTGAIFREQPIGTGYVIQGAANAAYGLVARDFAKETGWVDEFDNMCVYPSSSGTPSLPSVGIIISFIFIGIITTSITTISKKRK